MDFPACPLRKIPNNQKIIRYNMTDINSTILVLSYHLLKLDSQNLTQFLFDSYSLWCVMFLSFYGKIFGHKACFSFIFVSILYQVYHWSKETHVLLYNVAISLRRNNAWMWVTVLQRLEIIGSGGNY